SLPDRTTTRSPFLIFCAAMMLQHLRREADDLHMLLRAQFADDRPEDTGTDRLGVVVDEDGRVRIEADRRTVRTVDVLGGADDDGLVDVALLHAAARSGFLHRDDDDVADAGEAALRPAEHLDALDALGPRIIGDLSVGLHLDHRSNSFFTSTGTGPAISFINRPEPVHNLRDVGLRRGGVGIDPVHHLPRLELRDRRGLFAAHGLALAELVALAMAMLP